MQGGNSFFLLIFSYIIILFTWVRWICLPGRWIQPETNSSFFKETFFSLWRQVFVFSFPKLMYSYANLIWLVGYGMRIIAHYNITKRKKPLTDKKNRISPPPKKKKKKKYFRQNCLVVIHEPLSSKINLNKEHKK